MPRTPPERGSRRRRGLLAFRERGSVRRIVAAAMLSLALVNDASGSTLELAREVNKAFDFSKLKSGDVEQRRKLAAAMLAYWSSFADRIPRISPTDVDWIEGELFSGENDRVTEIKNSPHYSQWVAARKVDYCVVRVQSIITYIGTSNPVEAAFWTDMLHCSLNGSELLALLTRAGLTNGHYDGPFHLAYFDVWTGALIDLVIVPLLLK